MSESIVLAIDVGGTKTALARVAIPSGSIRERMDLATPSGEAAGPPFLEAVEAGARKLQADAGLPAVAAVGLGICELVAPGGAIESGHRVRWRGLPVRERLSQLAPAVIEADVRAAAIAEARLGAGRAFRQFLYLNVGTGISTAWVVDGRAHAGARGHALVLASSRSAARCPACGATHDSVLEDLAGGAGIAERLATLSGRSVAGGRDVIAAASAGDPHALAVVDEAAAALGSALALVLGVLDPQALVIGGGLGSASGPYWDALLAQTRSRIWSPATRRLPIVRGTLGSDAGLLGAALVAQPAALAARVNPVNRGS